MFVKQILESREPLCSGVVLESVFLPPFVAVFLSKAQTGHPQCSAWTTSTCCSCLLHWKCQEGLNWLYENEADFSIVLKRQNRLFKYERVYSYLQASPVESCTGCMYTLPPACAVGPLSQHARCILLSMGHSGPVWEETACWSLNHRDIPNLRDLTDTKRVHSL